MGRVLEVHPGQDGLVRSITVKTDKTMLKRPINKVVLLVAAEEKEENAKGELGVPR